MRRNISICGAVTVLSIALSAGASGDDAATKPSVWMRTKLTHSQKVLAALVSEDFDAMAASAKSMNNLSELEKHARAAAPGYRAQLEVFRVANEDLIKNARKKDLEGCASAFQKLTQSCIKCHQALREKN